MGRFLRPAGGDSGSIREPVTTGRQFSEVLSVMKTFKLLVYCLCTVLVVDDLQPARRRHGGRRFLLSTKMSRRSRIGDNVTVSASVASFARKPAAEQWTVFLCMKCSVVQRGLSRVDLSSNL